MEVPQKGAAVKRSTPLPELLAPAGSEEALYAACEAGADAVYLGGRHSARAFAKNFDEVSPLAQINPQKEKIRRSIPYI